MCAKIIPFVKWGQQKGRFIMLDKEIGKEVMFMAFYKMIITCV